jgi:hypothetical protein
MMTHLSVLGVSTEQRSAEAGPLDRHNDLKWNGDDFIRPNSLSITYILASGTNLLFPYYAVHGRKSYSHMR